ncbi:MAG: hypothetical protein GX330_07430, partial [Bacteroidales bacterium]|nr:hypothetical protein [Bacteroidales bacterium]
MKRSILILSLLFSFSIVQVHSQGVLRNVVKKAKEITKEIDTKEENKTTTTP